MFWNSNQFNIYGKIVMITGASQGLGLALAKAAFSRGANVVIIARREPILQKAVADIEKFRVSETQTVSYIAADISIASEAERVMAETGPAPDVLMCCAGSSVPKLFTELTSEELTSGVATNYFTALYMAHAGLKAMAKTPIPEHHRHIVFFSSVVHFYSFIGYCQYAPLKSALRSLGDCLRHECIPYNIKVDVVFAGNFLSEGYTIENLTKPEITKKIEGASQPITADECAEKIIRELDRGNQMITTDFIGFVLSSMMLSGSPRINYLAQTFIAILLALFGPVWEWLVTKDIRNFYKNYPMTESETCPLSAKDGNEDTST
ncbi:hypothetical protein POJ06DRAFT_28453 [Lipomyces tetrasporus]|uniref:3-ketodihydrosphingosine reductase TSC10 n=1 Tax=Lipomyces tetrasporus TaxID=54092 RepID=A0AAD7QL37_9ASCO|nr:uncharacterized protein POJ06DRAFT_28453 [Lipomyces tetrasporus]KAJ8097279.1 hypothetical protein POJ06DRAFT_28453 [Lipomyces tetrasporus]